MKGIKKRQITSLLDSSSTPEDCISKLKELGVDEGNYELNWGPRKIGFFGLIGGKFVFTEVPIKKSQVERSHQYGQVPV